MSRIMRKPDFCICENKGADQGLCFHYIDSTIPLLLTGLPRSGKKVWKMKFFQFFPGQGKVREFQFLSGKFRKSGISQGKVREFENFQKVHCLKSSEKYNFYELQAVCGKEHYITNVNDLRGLFKTKSAKIKYLYKILKVSIYVILSRKWL